MSARITDDEWIAELLKASEKDPEFFTSKEWQERLKLKEDTFRSLLHIAHKRGLLEVKRERRSNIAGPAYVTTVYKFKQKK